MTEREALREAGLVANAAIRVRPERLIAAYVAPRSDLNSVRPSATAVSARRLSRKGREAARGAWNPNPRRTGQPRAFGQIIRVVRATAIMGR
jgi:hypothetical protein